MMLGLSKLCICLGGKWNLKLKKKISSESVKWTRNDPISSDLSQRIILIYPTDQTIIIPTDFPFFFCCSEPPDNWKRKHYAPNKLLAALCRLNFAMQDGNPQHFTHHTDREFQQTSLSLWSSHRSHLFLSELLKSNVWCFLLKSLWGSEEPLF